MKRQWMVDKFGGTSLADSSAVKRVGEILSEQNYELQLVVVSAMAGITDALLSVVEQAAQKNPQYEENLLRIGERYLGAARTLLGEAQLAQFAVLVETGLKDLKDVLRGLFVTKSVSKATSELVSGYGELWSAPLVALYLDSMKRSAIWLDARQVLFVKEGESGAVVDWDRSTEELKKWLNQYGRGHSIIVATGFVASDENGHPTTLGRNGSDFSAAIFGRLLKASQMTIWTDVDGVMSGDPNKVQEAIVLDELSYDEAMELAFFGAKVLHPSTMVPLIQDEIPIWIRNTFSRHRGSRIWKKSTSRQGGQAVKGFSTIDGVDLITVEGAGMLGVPGIAQRLFGALKSAGVSVIMISQASSEHSISFVVRSAQGQRARQAAEKEFFFELSHGLVHKVDWVQDASILSAVGDNMVSEPGVSAKFFSALAKANVNIRAIAQGSSERNISVVIDRKRSSVALRAAHSRFYLAPRTLSIGLIGFGGIGSTLISQIAAEADRLRRDYHIDMRVRGIMNSKSMWLEETRILLPIRERDFQQKGEKVDLKSFVEHIHSDHLPHSVLVDCTASDEIASFYVEWLERGLHIVTPNKKAHSGNFENYKKIREMGRSHRVHCLFETTVGAGLPVITTLHDLMETGDRIHRIEGVLSGTLSFLFNEFDGSTPFSALVAQAKQRGFTEPDPRDDLSGMDVARKLTILGREMGLPLHLDAVEVERLYPKEYDHLTVEKFLEQMHGEDRKFLDLFQRAQRSGEVLRFVGTVEMDGTASVRLKSFPLSHPFSRLNRSDNIISFTTDRYLDQPLIVQGPGAGPEVTAGGVFADLLRLSSILSGSL